MTSSRDRLQRAHREGPASHKFRRLARVSDACNGSTCAKVLEFCVDTRKTSSVPERTKSPQSQRFVWYGPAPVARRRTGSAARFAAAAAALVLAGVSAAGAARPGAALRRQAHSLDGRAHRALLELYALDTRLHSAQSRLASLEAQSARLRRAHAQLAQRLSATQQTLAVSQHELGDKLSMLYKQGDVSALAVVLGSQSLDDAVARLDDINRVADESSQVLAVTADAQSRLDRLRTTLADRRAQLDAAVAAARTTAASLAGARAARVGFVARLRREQSVKVAQIHSLEATAQRAARKSGALQAAAGADTVDAAPVTTPGGTGATSAPATGSRTITVSSTGYSLSGHTATGIPAGWGVVAVDPTVIPLGTRLRIPGYGRGVAADTGGAVQGASIDLWFPTLAQARAWGRRTITITLD
jgi:3D (Asp-Asp-Asp) domain-containing protein